MNVSLLRWTERRHALDFRMIIPFVDVMHRVTLRIITMPIQSARQGQRRDERSHAVIPAQDRL